MKFNYTDESLSYLQRTYVMLRAFWDFLKTILEKLDWDQFGEGVIYTFKMIWKHGIIIILMILPILLLVFLPQGRDLIINMLFDGSIGAGNIYVRVLWFLAMVVFTSYAIWAIPRFYQKYESDQKFTKSTRTAKSTSGDFLRILSVAPFVVYGIVFFVIEPRCFTNIYLFWSINILAVFVIVTLCFHLYYSNISISALLIILLTTCLIIPKGYSLLANPDKNNEFSIQVLGNSLLFLTGLAYIILLRWENLFKKHADSYQVIEKLEKKGDRVYYFVLGTSFVLMFLFSLVTNMMYVTSVSLLTMVMGCLILWFNLVFYKYKSLEGLWQFLFFVGLILIVIFIHTPESKPHRVLLTAKSNVGERPSLDTFMSKWMDYHYAELDTNEIAKNSIFLIAGEGGGSRAGLWYTTFIQEMDVLSGGKFSKQTFATSTISGSSVGASLLSKWYRVAEDQKLSRLDQKIASKLAKNFFTNNFTAGAIFDLFFLDIVRRLTCKPTRSGRNLRLQQEENAAYLKALDTKVSKLPDIWKPIDGKPGSETKFNKDKIISNYHFLPIQDLWLDKNGNYKLDIPLNFFNTTEMSTGRQFAVAPVSFSFDAYDKNSFDLISHIEKNNCEFKKSHSISLGTANNLSESFPFFSAYTHIDKTGHFMDGGGSDNSGTKTLRFIYNKLFKKVQDMKSTKKPPIVVIYISNGNADPRGKSAEQKKAKNQILALIGQAGAQPFEMITEESIHELQKVEKDPNSYYFEASWSSYNLYKKCPAGCKDTLQIVFPTARSLTSQNINSIEKFAKLKARDIYKILKSKNLIN